MLNDPNDKKPNEEPTNKPNLDEDAEMFLEAIQNVLNEIGHEEIFKTSKKWYFCLFIQTLFYFGLGLALMNIFEPFKMENNYIIYVFLGISSLINASIKIYTNKSVKQLIVLFKDYINVITSLILSIVIVIYMPGILNINYLSLVIYILCMIIGSDMVGKFVKKFIRGNYEKIK